MIATLVPEPGRTPIADAYRAITRLATRPDHGRFDRAAYDPASRKIDVAWLASTDSGGAGMGTYYVYPCDGFPCFMRHLLVKYTFPL